MPEDNDKFTPQFATPLAEQIEQFLINAILIGACVAISHAMLP